MVRQEAGEASGLPRLCSPLTACGTILSVRRAHNSQSTPQFYSQSKESTKWKEGLLSTEQNVRKAN